MPAQTNRAIEGSEGGGGHSAVHRRRGSPSLLFWVVLSTWCALIVAGASRAPFGGHADASNTLTVAKNLLAGKGFTVNYVTVFFHPRPIPHPEDMWPPLYPVLVAISMGVFGDNPVAWRIPNILLLALTVWLVRRIGFAISRHGPTADLIALVYLALVPDPIHVVNNILLTFLFVLASYSAVRLTLRYTHWGVLRLGLVFGMLLLAKPDSIFVVGGISLGIVVLGVIDPTMRERWALSRSLRATALALAVALTVWSPWLLRNYQLFGDPLFTEHQSLRVFHRYDDELVPHEETHAVRAAPELGEIVQRYGGARWWLREEAHVIYEGARLLLFSNVGIFAVAAVMIAVSHRRWGRLELRLLALTLASFICQTGFILFYWHYEERYFVPYLPIVLAFVVAHVVRMIRNAPIVPRALYSAVITALLLMLTAQQMVHFTRMLRFGSPVPPDVQWLASNTPIDSRIMTRDPWESYFHTGRETVMIPWGPLRDVESVAEQYGVDYLVLKKPSLRPRLLERLLRGDIDRFVKVFEGDRFVVFRVEPKDARVSTPS